MTLDGFKKWLDLVNERAKGELIIEWVGGPEALPSRDQAKAVQSGVVDMTLNLGGYYEPLVTVAGCLYLSQFDPVEERERGIYDAVLDSHKEAGLFYLGRGDHHVICGANLFTNVKVETPPDLAGLRFRASSRHVKFMDPLGIESINMPMGDIYSAMERGLVDGYATVWPTIRARALPEVTKYWIEPPYWASACVLIANLDKWNQIPNHLQDLMVNCMIEAEYWITEQSAKTLESELQAWREAGMEPITFSPEDAKWFLDLSQDVGWTSMIEKYPEIGLKMRELMTK